MKIISLLLSLFAVVSAARDLPVVAPEKVGLSSAKLAEVDAFMQRQVAGQKIAGGIVAICRNGKLAVYHTYGLRDREANAPMTPDTIFRIYSMSKSITTAAALILCDQKKIALDDPVSKYIPSFADLKVATTNGLRAPLRPMTIRDLMLHTCGLTYGGTGPDAMKEAWARLKPMDSTDLAQMTEKLSQIPMSFDPGTDWIYGVGIDVLGRVIEVASGESLDVYLEKNIFKPLDMRDTAFSVPPDKVYRFAVNYSRTNGLTALTNQAQMRYTNTVTFFSGGGGLVGTARDYMRFLSMIENGGKLDGRRVLKAKTAKLMTTDQLPREAFPIYFGREKRPGTGFGLGFSVRTEITTWDPSGRVGEYGWGGAASTHYWVSPKDRLIVATFEQIMPYQWDTEFGIKKIIYDAVQR